MIKPKFNGVEKYIFSDVYIFLTKYIDGDNSNNFWEECTKEAKTLCEKYNNNQLCIDLTIAALSDIEYKLSGKLDKHGLSYIERYNLFNTNK